MSLLADLVQILQKFVQQYWPGLAMALWNYEEAKVDAAEQKQKLAELKLKEMKNEMEVKESVAGLSDDAIIDKLTGVRSGSGNDTPDKK